MKKREVFHIFRTIFAIAIALTVTLSACIVSANGSMPPILFIETSGPALFVDSTSASLVGVVKNPGTETSVSGYFRYGTSLEPCPSNVCFTTTPVTLSGPTPNDRIAYVHLTDLTPSTQYWFQFCIISGNNGSHFGGGIGTFTTLSTATPTPVPLLVTHNATNRTHNSATLNGEITDMGGAATVDVFFKYHGLGSSALQGGYVSPVTVNAGTLSSAGTFSAPISGLNEYTVHMFQACATTATGDVCGVGVPGLFMTEVAPWTPTPSQTPTTPIPTPTPTPGPLVVAHAATDRTSSSATLNGEVTDMLGETSAAVYFTYQEIGQGNPISSVDAGTLLSTGTFSASISGLIPYTTYVFKACANTAPTGYDVCALLPRTFMLAP